MSLTEKQRATNDATWRHIWTLQKYLNICIKKLIDRAHAHDQSKLDTPEVELFAEHTESLKDLTFGSPEYQEALDALAPALEHHYAKNSHHPQHFKQGVDDMTLLDLIEMHCDWKAASLRHSDGNIRKSIEHNGERFGMSPQLIRIFENTIREFE